MIADDTDEWFYQPGDPARRFKFSYRTLLPQREHGAFWRSQFLTGLVAVRHFQF
jgi:hypothetical protein